jgi:uncharacterized membrane protein YidH (DUF202 family)
MALLIASLLIIVGFAGGVWYYREQQIEEEGDRPRRKVTALTVLGEVLFALFYGIQGAAIVVTLGIILFAALGMLGIFEFSELSNFDTSLTTLEILPVALMVIVFVAGAWWDFRERHGFRRGLGFKDFIESVGHAMVSGLMVVLVVSMLVGLVGGIVYGIVWVFQNR